MKPPIPEHNPMRPQFRAAADTRPRHFACTVDGGIATVTLNRPERKNPLTFDSYGELRDWFRALPFATDVRAVVLRGAGDDFCSGGDVHEIIGPLTRMTMPELLAFTRMTGDVVKAFCVLKPGHTPSLELVRALQEHVKQTLAPYKYPREIAFVDRLPRTETGKLQRYVLRQQASTTP